MIFISGKSIATSSKCVGRILQPHAHSTAYSRSDTARVEKRDHAFFGAGFQYRVASVTLIREEPLHCRMEFESANADLARHVPNLARVGFAFVRIHRGEGNQYAVALGTELLHVFFGIASKACLAFRIDGNNHSGDIALSIVGRCFLHSWQHAFCTRQIHDVSRHAGLELVVPVVVAVIAGLFGVSVAINGSDLGTIDHECRFENTPGNPNTCIVGFSSCRI